jgi:acyl dehydratase
MNMRQIRFDDIAALRGMISEEFGAWSPEVEVTQPTINRFADLTADHQWIHVDVERARTGPFGGTIAHGFLTLALMPKYKPPLSFEIVGESCRVNYGCESYRLLAPVLAGSRLRAHGRLMDVREHKHGTLLVRELVAYVVGNERPSLIYKGMLLYRP